MAIGKRRPKGSGSVYLDRSGRWRGRYRAYDIRTEKMVEVRLSGESRGEVEAKLYAVLGKPLRPVVTTKPPARPRLTEWQVVHSVLAEAERSGWDRDFTARVIVASTRPARVRLGVYGPCHYCGDWLADTVDHVHPRSRGGSDAPSNLVSACFACNIRKGERSAEEFRAEAVA